ncbi:MAG: hypothetical protein NTW08_05275 [Gammaproteobacteria bacterium]|nr:hypothetical protein [Gammaproteobacteria bacterium]
MSTIVQQVLTEWVSQGKLTDQDVTALKYQYWESVLLFLTSTFMVDKIANGEFTTVQEAAHFIYTKTTEFNRNILLAPEMTVLLE